VERLLSNLATQSFHTRDEQEVAGYAELMDLVFSSWQDIPFNEAIKWVSFYLGNRELKPSGAATGVSEPSLKASKTSASWALRDELCVIV
jgi:hypothetical protein